MAVSVDKYFSTLPAIAPHVSTTLQPDYVITALELPIGQSIRHVSWILTLVVSDSVALLHCEHNPLLL
jgi:hypothetical protein